MILEPWVLLNKLLECAFVWSQARNRPQRITDYKKLKRSTIKDSNMSYQQYLTWVPPYSKNISLFSSFSLIFHPQRTRREKYKSTFLYRTLYIVQRVAPKKPNVIKSWVTTATYIEIVRLARVERKTMSFASISLANSALSKLIPVPSLLPQWDELFVESLAD